VVEDVEGRKMGVAGTHAQLADRIISSQPVSGFDWSTDKAGVFVAAAFDQTLRVGLASRLTGL
jgi:hypothetical protein